MKKFTVTAEHLTLLRHANVGWCGDEFGAPTIDPKRPYGNSNVHRDIAGLLGFAPADPDGEFTAEQMQEMDLIHGGTQTALQIVLATGRFEAGTYTSEDWSTWQRVES